MKLFRRRNLRGLNARWCLMAIRARQTRASAKTLSYSTTEIDRIVFGADELH